jgi:hypothetical protein
VVVDIAQERPHVAADVGRLGPLQVAGHVAGIHQNTAQQNQIALGGKDFRQRLGRGGFQRLILERVDLLAIVIEHGQVRVHRLIDDTVVDLVGARISPGCFSDLVQQTAHFGAIVFTTVMTKSDPKKMSRSAVSREPSESRRTPFITVKMYPGSSSTLAL